MNTANEPNHLRFSHAGLPCVIHRVPDTGHLCGYVGVPVGHPLHKIKYDAEAPSLQGRLDEMMDQPMGAFQFGRAISALSDQMRSTPETVLTVHGGITYGRDHAPGETDTDFWWFGFDCAHAGDHIPARRSTPYPGDVYRDISYVTDQCRALADQLAAIKPL